MGLLNLISLMQKNNRGGSRESVLSLRSSKKNMRKVKKNQGFLRHKNKGLKTF